MTNQTLCPIPHQGYCIYERCSYWDAQKQECDASCLLDHPAQESRDSGDFLPYDGPCTIHWTEDGD